LFGIRCNRKEHGIDVVTILQCIIHVHDFPKRDEVDTGPEFCSEDLEHWVYSKKVELDFSRPCEQSDIALVEAFNSRFRQECLDQQWFLSRDDTSTALIIWQHEYIAERPHIGLSHLIGRPVTSSRC
jgi:putative transposase